MIEPMDGPPPTRRDDVVEILHGEAITDPYRWLEGGDSPETQRWVAEQTAYTRGLLDAVPGRDRLQARLAELLEIGDLWTPAVRKGRYFYERREGEQNQPVLYLRQADAEDRPLLDPNEINPDGTTALDWWYPSRDGRLLAYGLSEDGDERSTLFILDVDAGIQFADVIPETRAASVAWLLDGSGFYYTRYPREGEVPAGEEQYHRHVFFHRLGMDPADDLSVFGEGRDSTDWPSVSLSSDGSYLLVTVGRGMDRSDCYLRRETPEPGPFLPLIEEAGVLNSVQGVGETIYLHTNLDAPRYRLVAVDAAHPEREHWRELVGEHASAVLVDVHIGGGRMLLSYLERACSRLEARNLDGAAPAAVPLPAVGSVWGISGEPDGDEALFAFTSFTTPAEVYRYSMDGSLRLWDRVAAAGLGDNCTVEQVTYPSRDGTAISMFVIAPKGLPQDGTRPAVLSGYGGFNISMTPVFSRTLQFWLAQGGVYAVPNLRGGSEYGEAWHQAGMLSHKQNVFDDFIAAAEYLCREGYTNPQKLAISGGSNGGLLIGVAITQRPDLFSAAVCAVPLLDMLRYQQFQIARLWIAEYGSAEDAEQFQWLRAYSPYHHVRDSVAYPAVLLLTGAGDTRVDPMHARKMTARLQASSTSGRPVLLRVETEAGHGAGRPRRLTLAEQTDVWAFLCSRLGVSL